MLASICGHRRLSEAGIQLLLSVKMVCFHDLGDNFGDRCDKCKTHTEYSCTLILSKTEFLHMHISVCETQSLYSRTSMAWNTFGTMTICSRQGSSSEWVLIRASDQEA